MPTASSRWSTGGFEATSSVPEIPAAPWRLESRFGFVFAGLAAIERVRAHVPSALAIVPVVPGFTLQVVAAARYEGNSTLRYSELLFAPALVRVAAGIGMYPARLYVDDDTSRHGGRKLWGLDKELAEFEWAERSESRGGTSYELTVSRGREPLLDYWWMPRWPSLPTRLSLPVVSMVEAEARLWRVSAEARVRMATHHLEFGGANALDELVPRTGGAFHLAPVTLRVDAP